MRVTKAAEEMEGAEVGAGGVRVRKAAEDVEGVQVGAHSVATSSLRALRRHGHGPRVAASREMNVRHEPEAERTPHRATDILP